MSLLDARFLHCSRAVPSSEAPSVGVPALYVRRAAGRSLAVFSDLARSRPTRSCYPPHTRPGASRADDPRPGTSSPAVRPRAGRRESNRLALLGGRETTSGPRCPAARRSPLDRPASEAAPRATRCSRATHQEPTGQRLRPVGETGSNPLVRKAGRYRRKSTRHESSVGYGANS